MEKSAPKPEIISKALDVDSVMHIGRLALTFSNVGRLIDRPKGERFENDAEHTFMLMLVAREVAAEIYPHLDLARVTEYALVHDLPEVYAGDTPTFYMTPELQKQKRQREHEALVRHRRELGSDSPNMQALENYELQLDAESRLVKFLDKLMPTIMHILNECKTLNDRLDVYSSDKFLSQIDKQSDQLKDYIAEFPEIAKLRDELVRQVCDMLDSKAL